MKIQNIYLLALVVFTFCLQACTPSEEDVHPKRHSARTENLKRYMPKAQELRAQVQLRAKPIVNGPLLTAQDLKDFVSKKPQFTLSSYMQNQRQTLQEEVRTEAAGQAAREVSSHLDTLRQELMEAVSSADSAQDVAQQLRSFADKYSQELNALADNTRQDAWALPTATQSRDSRESLKKKGEELLAKIQDVYGETCAQKARPVLAKAGDDYWLALSSVKNPEELKQSLEKTAQEADRAFAQTVAQYGDPKLSFSEEEIAALRARTVTQQQAVEQQFEKLYGKDAVLKIRDVFEPYLVKTDEILQQPGRLSQASAKLEEAGADFREKITALQVQFNDELEQKISTLRTPEPPSNAEPSTK